MRDLQTRRLIQNPTRHDVVGNQLVLVAPGDSTVKLKIAPHFPLGAALGRGRLAMGDPDSVPVGRYAREALTMVSCLYTKVDALRPSSHTLTVT
jgi:molybdate transport system substrate-binding protein